MNRSVPVIAALIILWFLTNLTRQEMIWISVFLGILTLVYAALALTRRTAVDSE